MDEQLNFKDKFVQFVLKCKESKLFWGIFAAVIVVIVSITIAILYNTNSVNTNATTTQITTTTITTTTTTAPTTTEKTIALTLEAKSVEEDLEVSILDKKKQLIKDVDFVLTIESKENNYKKEFTVNQGILSIDNLKAGEYTITIGNVEGYTIEQPTITCNVLKKVEYKKVENIKEEIKQVEDVNEKAEDSQYNNHSNSGAGSSSSSKPSTPSKIPSYSNKNATSKTYVTKYIYTAKISTGDFVEDNTGYILDKNNKPSEYIATVDKDGKIISDIMVMKPKTEKSTEIAAISDDTTEETPLLSIKDAVKAEVYVNNTQEISKDVLSSLQITDISETKTVYYDGWGPDKKSYYKSDGTAVTGTAIIGGVTYKFDKNGVIIKTLEAGIDVSKWQGKIDWQKVAKSGIEFAIIRVGYRGYGSAGTLVEDEYFKQNIEGATKAGIKVGVYFFSQATTTQEAVEEASMALELVKGYKLTYPIYFDTEKSSDPEGDGRADHLSKSQRTKIANAFCQTIKNSGYKAGIYASRNWYYDNLNFNELSQWDIWLAHYTDETDFKYDYDMWQYTSSGKVNGISGNVDLNWSYTIY